MNNEGYKEETSVEALILAGGKGTRMKGEVPKLMEEVDGKPMLAHGLNVKVVKVKKQEECDDTAGLFVNGVFIFSVPIIKEYLEKLKSKKENNAYEEKELGIIDFITAPNLSRKFPILCPLFLCIRSVSNF